MRGMRLARARGVGSTKVRLGVGAVLRTAVEGSQRCEGRGDQGGDGREDCTYMAHITSLPWCCITTLCIVIHHRHASVLFAPHVICSRS